MAGLPRQGAKPAVGERASKCKHAPSRWIETGSRNRDQQRPWAQIRYWEAQRERAAGAALLADIDTTITKDDVSTIQRFTSGNFDGDPTIDVGTGEDAGIETVTA